MDTWLFRKEWCFSPLPRLTVTEVKAIGYKLGLPCFVIEKIPSDDLYGKSDEENLGFSYEVLDRYIRTVICEDSMVRNRIDSLHEKSLFKLKLMPCFEYCALRVGFNFVILTMVIINVYLKRRCSYFK